MPFKVAVAHESGLHTLFVPLDCRAKNGYQQSAECQNAEEVKHEPAPEFWLLQIEVKRADLRCQHLPEDLPAESVCQTGDKKREARNQDYEAEQGEFQPHTATIYVRDELNWTRMNFYIWDSNGNSQLNGNWPGKQITATKEVNGYTWYYQTFDIASADYFVNVVFSTGNGSPQTVDVTEVNEDKYFVIKSTQSGGKYIVEEDRASSIATTTDNTTSPRQFFTLDGRPVLHPTAPGVYILRQGNQTKKININH